ncbi:MAG: hypothetical protein ABFC63_08970 [Thermoguttaceae bacterium]
MGRHPKIAVFCIVAVLIAVLCVLAHFLLVTSPAKTRGRVTISKATTYITEPLRPDGYPDYLGALNQQASRGVTPENNSAVLFWKAMGPGEIAKPCRERFFKMLGIPVLPETGDYFISSERMFERWMAAKEQAILQLNAKGVNAFPEQFQLIMMRPWTKREFPHWHDWLARNEKPLALLVEASKRPRRYDPLLCSDSDMVIACLLPGPQSSREVARALVARAMLRLGEGRTEDAWADLLACHRLARLVGQGTTLVEMLVAVTIDGMASEADQSLLEHAKLTAPQIAAMRADLAKLPPLPKMVDMIETGERFVFLDIVTTMAREGPSALSPLLGAARSESMLKSAVDAVGVVAIDWDIVLRIGNSWYDRAVVAAREPTRAQRIKAMDAIQAELRMVVGSARTMDATSLGLLVLGNTRKAVSERLGQILVGMLLPAFSAASHAEDRATTRIELNDLAFALAAYRADHGSYPVALADLSPRYIAVVPKDTFNRDADLHYKRQGNGYLLYSVGINGADDGGRGTEDGRAGEGWDDLTVRVPAKP